MRGPEYEPRDVPVDGPRHAREGVYRRDVVLALAGAAVLVVTKALWRAGEWLLNAANVRMAEQLWDREETEMVPIGGTCEVERPEGVPDLPPGICIPGLGGADGVGIGDAFRDDALGRDIARSTNLYGIVYGKEGIRLDKVAQKIREASGDTGRIAGIVESAGLLVFLAALDQMEDPPHLDMLTSISGPLGLDYVVPAKRVGVKYIVEHGIQGNALLDLAYHIRISEDPDVRDLLGWVSDTVEQAVTDTSHSAPPKVLTDCMEIIYHMRAEALLESLAQKGVITKDTLVVYLKSPPGRDSTVLADQACDDLRHIVLGLGAQFADYTYDGSHAQTKRAFEERGRTLFQTWVEWLTARSSTVKR